MTGGAVVFGDRTPWQSTAFTPLPTGTCELEVRLAGTMAVVVSQATRPA